MPRAAAPVLLAARARASICAGAGRGLRLREQRERDREFMRRSTRERQVVVMRIYLVKQCVYIYKVKVVIKEQ